jgi:hypothetical protein
MDEAVLAAIKRTVLTPEAVDYVVDRAIELIEDRLREQPEEVGKLEVEIKKVRRELDNFLALVADGVAPATALAEIVKREEPLKHLEGELLRLHVPQKLTELD